MRVFEPMVVTDALLISSNVPETDYAAWSGATAYVAGNRVIVVATHSVYEAVGATTGDDPTTDDGTNWVRAFATNRWRAFDSNVNQLVSNSLTVEYIIETDAFIDGIAFFELNASEVRVKVRDTTAALIYDETKAVIDTGEIINWLTFYIWEPEFAREMTFSDLPAYLGYTVEITVDGDSGTAQVGQIVLGRIRTIGTMMAGTEVGFVDYSTKERDATFGTITIVEREAARFADFSFFMPVDDEYRVIRIIQSLRAKATVWYLDDETAQKGTTIFGILGDRLNIPLASRGISVANIRIEGIN
tara:strand:+ start:2793 stop:3698 length:906 start_codon:yes stop_codon:yes gene_type:complete